MAARKSCTHLTWGEAKARSGQATVSGQTKNKAHLRRQDHGSLLAAKVIKKHGGDATQDKKLMKQYRKQEEKSAAIAAARLEEREQKRLESMKEVQPYSLSKQKVDAILEGYRSNTIESVLDDAIMERCKRGVDIDNVAVQNKLIECKRMQLDEMMALEAMVDEQNMVVLGDVTQLRESLDVLDSDPDNVTTRSSVVSHEPLSFIIRIEANDEDGHLIDEGGNANMELNALIVLRVTLPLLYLDASALDGDEEQESPPAAPLWEFIHVMVTDKSAFCSADKPLESLAWLDETGIRDAMNQQAEDGLLPYPCVYEVACTWLAENIFSYLNLQSHLVATSKQS